MGELVVGRVSQLLDDARSYLRGEVFQNVYVDPEEPLMEPKSKKTYPRIVTEIENLRVIETSKYIWTQIRNTNAAGDPYWDDDIQLEKGTLGIFNIDSARESRILYQLLLLFVQTHNITLKT